MAEPSQTIRRRGGRAVNLALRLLAATGLVYDAYVHLHLAGGFDANRGTVSQGTLFRLEAILAVVAAVLLLVLPRRLSYAFGLLVATGGVAAVVLYRYVDVGPLGPLPDMYEPSWYPAKTSSAVAEAAAALLLLLVLVVRSRPAATPEPAGAAQPR
jgi:hypothetical protein